MILVLTFGHPARRFRPQVVEEVEVVLPRRRKRQRDVAVGHADPLRRHRHREGDEGPGLPHGGSPGEVRGSAVRHRRWSIIVESDAESSNNHNGSWKWSSRYAYSTIKNRGSNEIIQGPRKKIINQLRVKPDGRGEMDGTGVGLNWKWEENEATAKCKLRGGAPSSVLPAEQPPAFAQPEHEGGRWSEHISHSKGQCASYITF